jgi:hypothetical protein
MARRRRSPKLTAKRRKRLRKSSFALKKQRKYPLDTRGRAANAKARATQQYKKGRISKATRDRIHAAANRRYNFKSSGKKRRRR